MSSFTSWQMAARAERATWVVGLVFLVLTGAFFRTQVIQHEAYRVTANNNHLRGIPLEAPRGDIRDRNGDIIAANIPGYSIKVLATREDSLRAVLGRMASLVPEAGLDIDAVVDRWKPSRWQPALVFPSGLPRTVATLEEHRAELPGLLIQREPRRRYPDSLAVAHLVGYVGEVSASELANDAFPGAEAGEIVGKQGLELEYDSLLRGRTGVHYVEVTSNGRMVRDQPAAGSLSPVAGRELQTTIDMSLQRFIDSMWRHDIPDKRGAMVAMTPQGEILALYSYPAFDPNAFIGGIDYDSYAALRDDPAKPLFNRAIQGKYPPASPFKLAIAVMALRRGLVTMDSRMPEPCHGSFTYGNRTWKCWDHAGHGALTLREAIATSCDVYFYQLGLLLGADAIFADGNAMGFGDRSGVDLQLEYAPTFPVSRVKTYINSRGVSTWSNGEVLNLAIGQGHDAQTLINMMSFYAALAGDGIKRAPYLVRGTQPHGGVNLGLTADQLSGLREAMHDVVRQGTASVGLAGEKGLVDYGVAGKTGSGQVTGQKDIGWFIGMAPYQAPKIIVGIQEEEGIHGGLIAKYAVRAMVKYLTGKSVKAEALGVTEDMSPPPPDSVAPDSGGAPPPGGHRR